MNVFDREQRARYEDLTRQLLASCRGIRELDDGFAFEMIDDPMVFVAAAEWITLERLCCPFLRFELALTRKVDVTLGLRGPAGVKEFLRAEFGRAWPRGPIP